jgi:hypothetical protein
MVQIFDGGYCPHNKLFFNLKERTRERMRASLLSGRFPWPAPIGYLNCGTKQPGASNLVLDPDRAPLVRKAFELVASGNYRKRDVLTMINDLGLRTRRSNQPLSAQTFIKLLEHPVYCGYVCSPTWKARAKGLHEPLVSEEMFNTVQDILKGKKPTATPHKRKNADFPLKGSVHCYSCGKKLTAGWSTNGHSEARKFGSYWCFNRDCLAIKSRHAQKHTLESSFAKLLDRLNPDPEALKQFPAILAEVWKQRQGDSDAIAKSLARNLDDHKKLKQALLVAKLKGEIPQSDYEQANALFDNEIATLESNYAEANSHKATFEQLLTFADKVLQNLGETWNHAGIDQKQRVQKVLFPNGLQYSPELGFLNHSKSSLFNDLEEFVSGKNLLASPTGFEPVLSP